jgi:O-methyltransferase
MRQPQEHHARLLYLELLKRCLTRFGFEEYEPLPGGSETLFRRTTFDPTLREQGLDRPAEAETMIGLKRLENLQECITDVLERSVPGDLIETGAWRGGATIFMRAILEAWGDVGRTVWVADSFSGLPKPSPDRYPADQGDRHWTQGDLAVPLEVVKRNFERYGLLDERVRFLAGSFADTLPRAPIDRLAVLRLDGDMYESTIVALRALYTYV